MNDIQLIKKLRGFDKPYFTVADLENILDMKRDSLYVKLNKMVKRDALIRLKRDTYCPPFEIIKFGRIANELYYPSYLSFETVLSRCGIISQIPYTITFATTRRTKTLILRKTEITYSHLKKEYFFGYTLKSGVYTADPEKAVLDQLYLASIGKRWIDTSEWSMIGMEKKKFIKYSKVFPKKVQGMAKDLLARFGKTVVTLEDKVLL